MADTNPPPLGVLQALADLVGLPPGAVATDAVVVIGSIDAAGEPSFHVGTAGDGTVSHALGLLTLAEASLIRTAIPSPGPGPCQNGGATHG